MRIKTNRKAPLGRPLVIVGAAVMLFGIAACDEDPVTVNLTEEQPMLHVYFDPLSGTLPSAAFDARILVDVDTNFTDAFGRGRAPLDNYSSIVTSAGTGMGFNAALGFRNSSQDPRLPALVSSDAAPGDFFALMNPSWAGVAAGAWDLFGTATGLKPNTTYTVVLARMALEQRGALDHARKLAGLSVLEPDSLFYLGGTEAGYPEVTCNFSVATGVVAGLNPLALGIVTTDDSGAVTIDCVPFATGDSPWWRSAASQTPPGAADSIPFGISSPSGELRPGQYNYILLIEGQGDTANPVPDNPPTVRIQMGPDVDASGAIINNAFAPFPKGSLPSSFYPDAPGFNGAYPDSVTVTLANLPSAGDGSYKVSFFDVVSGESIAAIGNLIVTAADGQETTVGQQATWGGNVNSTATFTITDATLASARVRDFTHIGISVEGGATSGEYAFWTEFASHNGTPDDFSDNSYVASTNLAFGRFQADDIEDSPVFTIAGNITGSFYHDTLLVVSEGSVRPPAGFEYHVWLTDATDPATLVSAGALELDEKGDGVLRIPSSSVNGPFSAYQSALITLEPAVASPTAPSVSSLFGSEIWTEKFPEVFGPSE